MSPNREPTPSVTPGQQRLVVWGTFDIGKPRVRLLVRAARQLDPDVAVCHHNLWDGIEDKTQIRSPLRWFSILMRWLWSYPRLLWRYLRLPPHDVVLIPYLGILDVVILAPFARIRGARVCWDVLLSIYDAVVDDRQMIPKQGLRARLLFGVEWLATRSASILLLDTNTHAAYMAELYRLPPDRVRRVLIGCETERFTPAPWAPPAGDQPLSVLYHGQFIPNHGLPVIIEAFHLIEASDAPPMELILIGRGQEEARIEQMLHERPLRSVQRIPWVPHDELPQHLADADICLGVFAGEGRATRVVPNKVYEILAIGRPLITSDTPGIRELVEPSPALRLVPSGDAAALAAALTELAVALRAPDAAQTIGSVLAPIPIGVAEVAQDLETALR